MLILLISRPFSDCHYTHYSKDSFALHVGGDSVSLKKIRSSCTRCRSSLPNDDHLFTTQNITELEQYYAPHDQDSPVSRSMKPFSRERILMIQEMIVVAMFTNVTNDVCIEKVKNIW